MWKWNQSLYHGMMTTLIEIFDSLCVCHTRRVTKAYQEKLEHQERVEWESQDQRSARYLNTQTSCRFQILNIRSWNSVNWSKTHEPDLLFFSSEGWTRSSGVIRLTRVAWRGRRSWTKGSNPRQNVKLCNLNMAPKKCFFSKWLTPKFHAENIDGIWQTLLSRIYRAPYIYRIAFFFIYTTE